MPCLNFNNEIVFHVLVLEKKESGWGYTEMSEEHKLSILRDLKHKPK